MESTEKINSIYSTLIRNKDIEMMNKVSNEDLYLFAIDLVDIEGSLKELLNKISFLETEVSNKDEVEDTMVDIIEEFRHILYHVRTSVFYNYLDIDAYK